MYNNASKKSACLRGKTIWHTGDALSNLFIYSKHIVIDDIKQ
jgi:hypothetical protein